MSIGALTVMADFLGAIGSGKKKNYIYKQTYIHLKLDQNLYSCSVRRWIKVKKRLSFLL